MTTLRALLYADARTLVNQWKSIRRSPGRAILWAFFVLFIAAGIVTRTLRAAHHQHLPIDTFTPQATSDAIVCFTIVAFGVTIAFGSRLAGLFAHPAEARFIIGSPAVPFVATMYVQARHIVVNSARQGLALLYGALIYLPDGLSAAAFVRDIVIVVGCFTAIAAVPLARQLLARPFVPVAIVIGCAVALAGAIPGLRDLAVLFELGPPFGAVLLAIPAWHPGDVLLGGAGMQIALLAFIALFIFATFAFVAQRARDAYPELYELSMHRLQRTEGLRARMFGARTEPVKNASTTHHSKRAPAVSGVGIYLWRAWTEYRRSNAVRSTIIEIVLLVGGGYAGALLTGAHPMRLVPILTTPVVLLFLLALSRAAALASELRRPLFWLSSATLFERLCGLAAAHSWRLCAWFVLIAAGLTAGGAPAAFGAATIIAGPAAVVLAVGVGYASYALLPHEVDQRGPMMFARMLLGYALVLPPAAVAIAVGFIAHTAIGAFAAAGVASLAEAALLVGFASWRLDRMSIALR